MHGSVHTLILQIQTKVESSLPCLDPCRARLMSNSSALEATGDALMEHDASLSPLLKGAIQGRQTCWKVAGVAITHKFAEAEV